MKLISLITIGFALLISLTGCTVKMVDGASMELAATPDMDNRFYQGVYTGCIQTLIVQNGDNSSTAPALSQEIARKCMVIAAFALKNETHTIVIPGWPGLDNMRGIIEKVEDEKVDPNVVSF